MLRAVINTNIRQKLLPLHALRRRFENTLPSLRVGVLGLSLKPGADDIRDAPSLDLIHALADWGAQVQPCDPEASGNAHPSLPLSANPVPSAAEAAD